MSDPKMGKTVKRGYIFMGYFSPAGRCDALKYAAGREWREIVLEDKSKENGGRALRYQAGWIPVREYIAHLESYRSVHPTFADKMLADIEYDEDTPVGG